MKLSIIIPAYNEESGIGKTIERIWNSKEKIIENGMEDVEIIVVNDCSTDDTFDEVSKYDVKLITHKHNKGYGAALKTGFRNANGDLLAFLDADGTYPPEYLYKLCRELIDNDADIVVGSRLAGKYTEMSKIRYMGNRFFAKFLGILTGSKITDTASGMRVFKKSVLPRIYPLPDDLEFTPVMSTRAVHEDLKMMEDPITYQERMGESKLSPSRHGYRFLMGMLSMVTQYRPLKIFGTIGLLLILAGVLIGMPSLVYYIQTHTVPDYLIYRSMASLILIAGGINLVTFGILSDIIVHVLHGKEMNTCRVRKFVYSPHFFARYDILGVILIVLGIVLNMPMMLEYITTMNITLHWSYIISGALLIILGVQLFTSNTLARTIKEICEREKNIQRDI